MEKLKIFFKKNKANILFISCLLIISFFYNYHTILTYRSYSNHQWRQADCLSITMNYYKENRSFLEPAIHWVGEKDGKTVSECPLIYYSVAKLWKVFGYHESIFRLINILIVFLGLFSLFKLVKGLTSDIFWSLIVTFLLFTSPILVYYTNNFTADAPAFGFALIGCFFWWKGYNLKKRNWYYFAFLFFLLGGLIKISSLIIFVAIIAIHFYTIIFIKNEKSWFFRLYSIIPYVVVMAILLVWYKYAIYYNQKNISGIFLTGIYPIWGVDSLAVKNIWLSFKNELLPAFFSKKALCLIFMFFIALFFFYRKLNKFLFYINIFVFFGVFAYIILFYQAFTVHDYYLTNLLIIVPLPIITIIEMMSRHYQHILKLLPIKILALCVLILLVYKTSVVNRMKYSVDDWMVKTSVLDNKDKVDYWAWYHWDYANRFQAYETITPYLRSIGIKRTDRVLSLPDKSINISLYFMDQKGFTAFGYEDMDFEKRMQLYKKNGVKYLIVDSILNKEVYLKPYLNYKIGGYKNIDIYDLK